MLPVPDAVAAKLPHLPDGPGVYLWKGRDGTTLYVGKAKRLRTRVRSYFGNDQLESLKTRHLVGLIADQGFMRRQPIGCNEPRNIVGQRGLVCGETDLPGLL